MLQVVECVESSPYTRTREQTNTILCTHVLAKSGVHNVSNRHVSADTQCQHESLMCSQQQAGAAEQSRGTVHKPLKPSTGIKCTNKHNITSHERCVLIVERCVLIVWQMFQTGVCQLSQSGNAHHVVAVDAVTWAFEVEGANHRRFYRDGFHLSIPGTGTARPSLSHQML